MDYAELFLFVPKPPHIMFYEIMNFSKYVRAKLS